jgi:hypothetical protein
MLISMEIIIIQGILLRCRRFIKKDKQKVYVNFVYKVTYIDRKNFTIQDIISNTYITLKIKSLKKFTFNYSATCHSLQGITVSDAITIFDINYWV